LLRLYVVLSAVIIVAAAGWGVGAAMDWPVLSDWGPNVAVEAASVLVTVAVVQRLLERREEKRVSLRRHFVWEDMARAIDRVAVDLEGEFALSHGVVDTRAHHLGGATAREVISAYREQRNYAETPLQTEFARWEVSRSLEHLESTLESHRLRDLDIFQHDFIARLDAYLDTLHTILGPLKKATRDDDVDDLVSWFETLSEWFCRETLDFVDYFEHETGGVVRCTRSKDLGPSLIHPDD
jgi:hypothetical protein